MPLNNTVLSPLIFLGVVSVSIAYTDYLLRCKRSDGSQNPHQASLTIKLRNDKEIAELNKGSKVYKFVLTGGPCSGKSTATARLQVSKALLNSITAYQKRGG